MRDPKLEQELTLLQSLMGEAKAFRDIIQATWSTEVVVPENEGRFEVLREGLPALSQRFCEAAGLADNHTVEELFGSVKDLPSIIRFTDLEKNKLYDRWHRYYMGLYAVQGRLKQRKERLDGISPAAQTLKRLLLNPFVLLIVAGVLVLLVLVLKK